jgi:hypothetical protein
MTQMIAAPREVIIRGLGPDTVESPGFLSPLRTDAEAGQAEGRRTPSACRLEVREPTLHYTPPTPRTSITGRFQACGVLLARLSRLLSLGILDPPF